MCVALILLVPLGTGQVASDPEGDVQWYLAEQPADDVAGRGGAIDLKSLEIEETQIDLTFQLTVADLSADTQVPFMDTVFYNLRFQHDGLQFQLEMTRYIQETGDARYASRLLAGAIGSEELDDLRDAPDVTVEADTMQVSIARDRVAGVGGAPPSLGGSLTELYVTADGARFVNMCLLECMSASRGADRMPDDGTVEYTFTKGVEQVGAILLSSKEPFRISNGGAGTYVFQVHASNSGSATLGARFGVEDVPDGWQVSLPADRIVMEAGSTESFPVLLTTPSRHEHGTVKSFLLTLTSGQDIGRISLGIHYTNTPQPTGHHPTLFLHSNDVSASPVDPLVQTATGFPYHSWPYMNAVEDDPMDAGLPVPSQGVAFVGIESAMRWDIPISPGLGVGLDFDTRSPARFQATLHYDYLAENVVLTGDLVLTTPTDEIVLATIDPSTPVSFGPTADQSFDVSLTISRGADYIPHTQDSSLRLVLDATGIWNAPFVGPGVTPMLQPGGQLDLPLREYHDPVDAFYDASRLLRFSTTLLEKEANAGDVVVFESALHNGGSDARDIVLNLTGTNLEWARILGDAEFRLGPGRDRTVAVAVTVPADAADSTLADLVLQARDADDPHRIALLDLLTIIDESTDHPDDAHRIPELEETLQAGKKSPGVAPGVLLALLAGLLRRGGN